MAIAWAMLALLWLALVKRRRLGYCDRGRSKPLEPSSPLNGVYPRNARSYGPSLCLCASCPS
jgi:hypothetical protein